MWFANRRYKVEDEVSRGSSDIVLIRDSLPRVATQMLHRDNYSWEGDCFRQIEPASFCKGRTAPLISQRSESRQLYSLHSLDYCIRVPS